MGKEKFIDIRLRGKFRVKAATREEAAEKVRRRIMDEVLTKHPSFKSTGLPAHWETWLDNESEKMLGIEVEKEGKETDENLHISWSNEYGGKLYKDGIMAFLRSKKE